jgi:trimeric autotransporter adhesin
VLLVRTASPARVPSAPRLRRRRARSPPNLYFEADDGTHGTQLWTSDGTAAGTLQIGSGAAVVSVDGLATAGGRIVFATNTAPGIEKFSAISAASPGGPVAPLAATDPSSPLELFVSDGTAAGVHQLSGGSSPLSSSPSNLVAAGSELYFGAASSSSGVTLWRSAGTAASTMPVAVSPAPGTPAPVAAFGGVVFLQYVGASLQLWRSDGTVAGT